MRVIVYFKDTGLYETYHHITRISGSDGIITLARGESVLTLREGEIITVTIEKKELRGWDI